MTAFGFFMKFNAIINNQHSMVFSEILKSICEIGVLKTLLLLTKPRFSWEDFLRPVNQKDTVLHVYLCMFNKEISGTRSEVVSVQKWCERKRKTKDFRKWPRSGRRWLLCVGMTTALLEVDFRHPPTSSSPPPPTPPLPPSPPVGKKNGRQ